MASAAPVPPMQWGTAPDLVGPRHVYRVDRLARCLRAAIPRGAILDAGCGAGALTERLLRMGYRVTAVDDSPEFVTHTRSRAQRLGLAHRLEALQADLQSLKLPPESFDGAVCGEVLEHLPDDTAAVRAMAGALKSGGALALTVPADADRFDWLDRWAGHERRYDEPDLRRLLTSAGLSVERIVRWGFPFMTLYERFVQRPGLGRASRSAGQRSLTARAARSAPVTLALGWLFRLDEPFEGRSTRGTGLLAVARKP